MRVCILGSGLTALTLAKALVNQNIFVDLISSNKNHKINHSRTIGISKSNFNYFNRNITNIEKISWKLKKIEIFTDKNKNEKILNFENSDEQLFSIIKNFKLYEVLNKNLFVKFLLISLSIIAIYITGVPWLAYLAGWEVAYVWGIKNFVLAEIFKIAILTLVTEKLLKIRKII